MAKNFPKLNKTYAEYFERIRNDDSDLYFKQKAILLTINVYEKNCVYTGTHMNKFFCFHREHILHYGDKINVFPFE